MATNLFCDHAGFTGDNLVQREQPFFGFAAIAIEPDKAADLVRRLRDPFSVVGGELSGRRLYLRPDARELISWLLAELIGRRARRDLQPVGQVL